MKLRNVRLVHFRNHADTAFPISPAINVFVGKNGEGKTNILEGISYLCVTKSFYASNDSMALQLGADEFTVRGTFEADGGLTFDTQVSYTGAARRKEITINGQSPGSLAEVVGRFPVVVLSPENSNITFGSPADRRRFIDLVISQSDRGYLEDLLEYRRVLRQRNRILADERENRGDIESILGPWTVGLVNSGARILWRRMMFVKEFEPDVRAAFARVASGGEQPGLKYQGTVASAEDGDAASLAAEFEKAIERSAADERRAGLTLIGPHRDELLLTINGLDLRGYASQGQHKTFLVALKLAECSYLRERCREIPVLLLDDVLSELDSERSARVLLETRTLGQTFITATETQAFDRVYGKGGYRRFTVQAGRVTDDDEK